MARSRRVYAEKLLAQFPDDRTLEQYYSSTVIAPRFLERVMVDARIALRRGDPEMIRTCLADVAMLRAHIARSTGTDTGRREFLITAIIPLYNGGRFIQETLESVLAQTMIPDEIIVVDDGSTDNGADIVRRMAQDHPIRLLEKPNGGQSSARNHGVAHAHGDLIAFLDHDDVWYPHHLATLLEPFAGSRPTELGWTYSNLDRIDQDGSMQIRSFLSGLGASHPKMTLIDCLGQDMFILPSATLIDRKAFLEVGGFDESLSGFEDDDLFLRLFRAGYDNVYVDEALSRWRIFSESASYSPRMAKSRRIYAEKLLAQFPDDRRLAQYHSSGVIAPRFFTSMLAEYRKAVSFGSRDEARMALSDVSFIARHLRLRLRLIVMPVLPFLRIRPVARVLLGLARLMPGVARKLGGA
jgi:glycosyltransferase involved in cell wall biosynthesis